MLFLMLHNSAFIRDHDKFSSDEHCRLNHITLWNVMRVEHIPVSYAASGSSLPTPYQAVTFQWNLFKSDNISTLWHHKLIIHTSKRWEYSEAHTRATDPSYPSQNPWFALPKRANNDWPYNSGQMSEVRRNSLGSRSGHWVCITNRSPIVSLLLYYLINE